MEDIAAPYQTVLITCRGNADLIGRFMEKDNVSVVNFHAPISRDPPLYMISLHKRRLSINIIRESGQFVVNFMPFSEMEKVQIVDKYNGLQLDKFQTSNLGKEEAKVLDCPRLMEGVGHLECEVVAEHDYGDHILFIGKVLYSEHKRHADRLLNMGYQRFTGFRWTDGQ
jgi:flavin reductase (DIM6/NTAB) family NADH-FMN oxidoreductase RutF